MVQGDADDDKASQEEEITQSLIGRKIRDVRVRNTVIEEHHRLVNEQPDEEPPSVVRRGIVEDKGVDGYLDRSGSTCRSDGFHRYSDCRLHGYEHREGATGHDAEVNASGAANTRFQASYSVASRGRMKNSQRQYSVFERSEFQLAIICSVRRRTFGTASPISS